MFKVKPNFIIIFLVLTSIPVNTKSIESELQSIPYLNHYEIIHNIDITHTKVSKRSTELEDNGNQLDEQLVSFRAINIDFNLLLTQSKDIISSQITAYTIDSKGHKNPIFVDSTQFYSGRVDGIDGSDVRAHIEPNGLMTALIHTGDETYEVEPIWRHLDNHNSNFSAMIIYKHKDIKHSSTSSDGSNQFRVYNKIDDNNDVFETNYRIRRKRFFDLNQILITDYMNGRNLIPVRTQCALFLVADYVFFEAVGNADPKTTINYLIHIIDRVNNIFVNTEWTDNESKAGFKGMGFVIKEIKIHSEPTTDPKHYNYHISGTERPVRELLESFSQNKDNNWFCLAHLFTHQTLENSVLGLAAVASPRPGSVGGICGDNQLKAETTLYLNTGLTSTKNSLGKRIITREAVLVTAHELGHNWGSDHDPDTDECSPTAQNGGSYLMFAIAVSGYDVNNKVFSPCSIRSIYAVLVHKSQKCFIEPDKTFCGNSIVEPGEECDEGFLLINQMEGLCCDRRCKLIAGSDCSDQNSDCCASCRIRPAGTVCKHMDELNCKQESYCDGESDKCPESAPLPDQTPCLDMGQCIAGKCISYCEARGQLTCLCDHKYDACLRCCRSNITNGLCKPVAPRDPLPNGTPCRYGFCENERCVKFFVDFVPHFWDMSEGWLRRIYNLVQNNLVFTVVFLTLIISIVIICAVYFYQNRRRRDRYRIYYTSFDQQLNPPGIKEELL